MPDVGLYVVGTGGTGREVLDVALALGVTVTAFVDERTAGSEVRHLPVVLPTQALAGEFLVGIADPAVRRRLADLLSAQGLAPRTLVHPAAVVAPATTLGDGSVVMALAHVSSDVTAGRNVQVQYGASVGHDCVLADLVTVLPGARVSGGVHLGEGATVGSGAVVLQGRTIGAGAYVGAGAVVTRDVDPGAVVVGNPARLLVRSASGHG